MTDTPKPADAELLRYIAERTDDSKLTIYVGDEEVAPRLRALADALGKIGQEDVDWLRSAVVVEERDGDRYEQSRESAARQDAIAAKLAALLPPE